MLSKSGSASETTNGVIAASAAFLAWGFMPLYWWLLDSLPAFEILNNRIFWSFFFLLIYLLAKGRLGATLLLFKETKIVLALLASGLLLAGNWLLYIWAVNSNQVLATSLGYYINPLINIFIGRLFFKDRTSPVAWVAIVFAFTGVAYQIYSFGSVPIVSLGLGFSFAIYGLLRKIAVVEALPGLFIETALLTPFAAGFLIWMAYTGENELINQHSLPLWGYILCIGPFTTLPLLWFTYGARRIQFTTLGLLQYLGPSISFILGIFVFKEPCTAETLTTFALIWVALALYSWDNIRYHQAKRKGAKQKKI